MGPGTEELTFKRRRLLKTGAATSLGLSSVTLVQASNDEVEIIVARDKDGGVKIKKVPKKWYDHKNNVEEGAKRLRATLRDESGVASVGVGGDDGTIDGYGRKKIIVGVRDKNAKNSVPQEVRGVPVEIRKAGRMKGQSEYYAGLPFANNVGAATFGGRTLYDNNFYLVTALHTLYEANWCDADGEDYDVVGDPVYEYTSIGTGDKIGEVASIFSEQDAALIELDTEYAQTNDIDDHSENIEGWVTKDGLSTLESNSDDVHIQGAFSGHSTVKIDEYDEILECSGGLPHITEAIIYDDAPTQGGDSGSPVFWVDDGEAWLCGIVFGLKENYDCGWFCTEDRTVGPSAYGLNLAGMEFG